MIIVSLIKKIQIVNYTKNNDLNFELLSSTTQVISHTLMFPTFYFCVWE